MRSMWYKKNGQIVYLYKNKKAIVFLRILDNIFKYLSIKKRNIPYHVKKILLIKPDHLGDMLLLTSMIPLIKNRFPEAQIDVVCAPWNMEILKGSPYISEVFTIRHFMHNRAKVHVFRKFIVFLFDYLKLWLFLRQK